MDYEIAGIVISECPANAPQRKQKGAAFLQPLEFVGGIGAIE